ncbi:MAG: cobalamin-dependent protein [Acidimicrobiales bacterium]
MKVTFVALGQEQLAVSLLSSVLQREGHETSLVYNPALFDDRYYLDVPLLGRFFDRFDRVIDEIVAEAPDLLAFSVITPTYQWFVAVANAVKARMDVPVIFGGVHPSAVPEVCLENDCVDYVCVGEGEEALVRLCEVLPPAGERPATPIANLAWMDRGTLVRGPSAPFLADLDSLPYWDKAMWADHVRIADNWVTMSSRGCPYRCTFCFNNFFAKIPGKGNSRGYLRQRSIGHMMGELVEAKATFDIKRVEFDDDIFTTKKQWIHDFLIEYRREIDVPFICLVHPRYIDRDMARWLKDAGCLSVQMGVQSADEEYKRHELLRMENDAHLRDSLASLKSANLDAKLDHMLGLPGEPLEAQELALELYKEFPPRRISTFWLTHLPGVELTKQAVARGDLTEEDYASINRGESGRFHTRSFIHASDQKIYRRYELLYRLIPLLPTPLRVRAEVKYIPDLPAPVADVVGMVLEGVSSVLQRDTEAPIYLRYYRHQLRRQLPEILRDIVARRRPILGPPPRPDAARPTVHTASPTAAAVDLTAEPTVEEWQPVELVPRRSAPPTTV